MERVYVSGAWREMQAADGADGTREAVNARQAQNGIICVICVICGKYKHSELRDLLDGKDTWSLERVFVSGAWRGMQAADGADGTQMERV